jgi:hypothetical protein
MTKRPSKVNKWTSGQDDYLRKNWSVLTVAEIAEPMARTKAAIKQRARHLGLASKNPPREVEARDTDETSKQFTPEQSEHSSATDNTDTEPPIVETPAMGEDRDDKDRWAAAKTRRNKSREALTNLGALAEQKLVAPTREGFRRYWANDDGNRLADMLNKGYDFVRKGSIGSENVFSDDSGDKISQFVGKTKTNDPMRAYLMEIPEGWYLEDLKQREERRRSIEKDIKRVAHGGGQSRSADGSSVMYVPSQGSSHFDV